MLMASETAPRTKNKPKYVNIFIDVILKAMVSLYFQKFNIYSSCINDMYTYFSITST